MNYALLIVFLLLPLEAVAEEEVWLGMDRNTWPQTEYRKTENGFGGWLLATSDVDWKEKWDTPSGTIPSFRKADRVSRGEEVAILTFFVNPKPGEDGNVQVLCALKVTRPDASISVDMDDIRCMEGRLRGSQDNVRLSPVIINFVGEEDDPLGDWVVEVEVFDVVRDTNIQLKTSFLLVEDGGEIVR